MVREWLNRGVGYFLDRTSPCSMGKVSEGQVHEMIGVELCANCCKTFQIQHPIFV